jgi:D-alanyl-D-alanine carboxypeptidase/D-alanyl-D-alanine-endopeptidase (penicillin-binding protein 4)
VVATGVTFIDGAVVGDGSRYDDEWVVDTWADGVAFVDAGPYDALMVNDSRALYAAGRQSDPNSAAARELVRLLNERGVTVNLGWTTGETPPDVPELASIESAPLLDVLAEMLTTSDNNTAELLVKEIGLTDSGEGTRVAGLNAIDRTLRTWDVPMQGVRILDGSGLSAGNQVTCGALSAVLRRERDGPLPGALPVAGRSGTLSDEFVDSPIAGRLRAKTGTLGNPPVEEDPPAVKALAGYVLQGQRRRAAGAAPLEVVVVLNGRAANAAEQYRAVWEAFGEALATYPEGPRPADLAPR